MSKEINFDLKSLIDYIESEYGIERSVAISIIEESMIKSARNHKHFTKDLNIIIDEKSGKIRVFDKVVVDNELTGVGIVNSTLGKRINHGKEVQEGDVLDVEYPASVLGRACARECKMLIVQKLKQAKNFNIVANYKNRVGDIVSGIVSGIEKGNIIFNINGKVEAVIPKKERILKEKYKIGDSITGVIVGINEKQRNSPIVVSRADKLFLTQLLHQEVSEIADGIVEVVNVSRNPGFRSKIVVKSRDPKVDPVGACVGRKGMRINHVKNSLQGEKIDIVRFSDNIDDMIKEAFSPAKIESIEIDPINPSIINVTVYPDQYATAVGKFGSNVRMVSEIVGKKIFIKKSLALMSFDEQKEYAISTMSELFSISNNVAEQIVNAGYLSPEGIVADDEASFISSTGLDEVTGKGIYAASQVVAGGEMKI
jgi:transcription termination/antitermination protein NusA